uniref:DNA polymerase n=1 Tax=Pseudomonas phage Arace01 TaxID=3138526 RepID=A0AAU6VZW9_9VIRU
MAYLHYSADEKDEYPVVLLTQVIRKDEIKKYYLDPFPWMDKDDLMVLSLHQSKEKKKTPMGEMRQYIAEELVPIFEQLKTQYVLVADAEYFKALTKLPKTDPYAGYAVDCEYGDFKVIYVPNYKAMFYDPIKVTKGIEQGMNALLKHAEGDYQDPGTSIIHFAEYPRTTEDIKQWLIKLLAMDCPLTIDIEGFALKHNKAGIGSISFAWNKHEGIAFPVDYTDDPWSEGEGNKKIQHYGRNVRNEPVRELLRWFFVELSKKAIYHNIAFDVYVLIYQLFMKDILDTEGLLYGLEVMLKNWDCTKLISYVATNSCAGNKLGLKDQAQEFAGNYAVEEIKDITRIPMDKLLTYNLVDSLSTWFVHEKRVPGMIQDRQEDFYQNIFQPATVDVIQMQLTGMPVNMVRVNEVGILLEKDRDNAVARMNQSKIVQAYQYQRKEEWVNERNTKLKTKVVTLADADEEMKRKKSVVRWNPNSPIQLQELLYNILALPVIAYTDSKQPSCDADTLKALKNHTDKQEVKDLLDALLDFAAVSTILQTFLPALKNSAMGPDGWHYMFGNFNLGGTVSGRLSSSKPNMQNLPANSRYAKLIKSCFQAPPGWLLMGLDFASLEDRISALTSKDPNKLKVYTDGYDGHSLRTFAYFPDQCVGIIDTVESINSIQWKFKDLRYESKAPTFALTYQGTYKTLMTNCGFSESKAKLVEARYHELYVVSDAWVDSKLQQASKDGYITAAFGLRVRTPLLHQVIRGTRQTPFQAEAEGRTAGNALGQSWCLLNSRAGSEFMGKVRASEQRLNIRPCAQIHDAQYFLVKDDIDTVMYCNEHLVKAVQWQDDPEIWHDEVKLGGDLSLFYPDWSKEAVIPNGATADQIYGVIQEHMDWINAGCPKRE